MNRFGILLILVLITNYSSISQTGISNSVSTACDPLVTNFMNNYNIPGLSFALAKDGKLVYMRGFGTANLNNTESTFPHHLFRIASLSKPLTSIGIMKLIENGQLNLTDNVFGASGILSTNSYLSSATITDSRIYDITLQNLLEHSAGWNRGISCFPNPTSPYPYFFNGCDPIVAPLHVAQQIGSTNPVSEEGMIYFLLEKGLDFDPGTQYQYSNIGYLVLGEIIEAVTGLSYGDYMKQNIFEPIGACDTHLGKNLLVDKQEREMEYEGNGYTNLDIFGNGTYVPWEYGGFNIEAMDAHGGWISTARDLVRILLAVDNFNTKPDILTSATINSMVSPSSNNSFYAKGWSVNSANNWWHTGALDGTATLFVRTNSGYTWAVLLNKRVTGATNFWSDLDALPWNCISSVSSYPSYDLLNSPTSHSKDLEFTQVSDTECQLQWQTGNGTRRIVIARQGNSVNRFPIDGQNYSANLNFGSGSHLGFGNYVIYDGTSNNINVSGLAYGGNYYFRIFEYNQNSNTGNHKLYNLSKSRSYQYDADWYCPVTLTINSSPPYGLNYFASQSINSTVTIGNNYSVNHYAGNNVTLSTDFEVLQGAQFLADISNCDDYLGRICTSAKYTPTTGVFFARGPDRSNGAQQVDATHANWFEFIPQVSKRYSISSCDEGVDTRVYLYSGDCTNLTLLAFSDDDCSTGVGTNYASSIVDIYLNAGVSYLIEWDDRWSTSDFHFEIR